MTDSRQISQWEIWNANWRHEDGTSKVRPALVFSRTADNQRSEVITFIKDFHPVPQRASTGWSSAKVIHLSQKPV